MCKGNEKRPRFKKFNGWKGNPMQYMIPVGLGIEDVSQELVTAHKSRTLSIEKLKLLHAWRMGGWVFWFIHPVAISGVVPIWQASSYAPSTLSASGHCYRT